MHACCHFPSVPTEVGILDMSAHLPVDCPSSRHYLRPNSTSPTSTILSRTNYIKYTIPVARIITYVYCFIIYYFIFGVVVTVHLLGLLAYNTRLSRGWLLYFGQKPEEWVTTNLYTSYI